MYKEKQEIINIALDRKIPFSEAKEIHAQDTHANIHKQHSSEPLETEQIKEELNFLRRRVDELETNNLFLNCMLITCTSLYVHMYKF